MQKIKMFFRELVKESKGMETVEYAVVAALVISVTILVWTELGGAIIVKIEALTSAIAP